MADEIPFQLRQHNFACFVKYLFQMEEEFEDNDNIAKASDSTPDKTASWMDVGEIEAICKDLIQGKIEMDNSNDDAQRDSDDTGNLFALEMMTDIADIVKTLVSWYECVRSRNCDDQTMFQVAKTVAKAKQELSKLD